MGVSGTGIQSIKGRVQLAIDYSRQLIVQSKILRMRTNAMLDRLDEHIESSNSTGFRDHSYFRDPSSRVVLNWVMESALEIAGTDMANLQLLDPASGALYIAAQYGFNRPFLEFFGCVHEGEAACGRAFKARRKVVVTDVTESAVFCGTPALEVLLDARVRAVQSTPLIGSSGEIRGILSTHWSSPKCPGDQDLIQLGCLARVVPDWLECRVRI